MYYYTHKSKVAIRNTLDKELYDAYYDADSMQCFVVDGRGMVYSTEFDAKMLIGLFITDNPGSKMLGRVYTRYLGPIDVLEYGGDIRHTINIPVTSHDKEAGQITLDGESLYTYKTLVSEDPLIVEGLGRYDGEQPLPPIICQVKLPIRPGDKLSDTIMTTEIINDKQ